MVRQFNVFQKLTKEFSFNLITIRLFVSICTWLVKLLGHLEMTTVDYFVPYYINEQQSEIRGIKRGWYTMDERGKLCSGPFLSP